MSEKVLQPHQQRVVNEFNELDDKQEKLALFILENPIFGTLPKEEKKDLAEQLKVMENYLDILQRRINRF